MPTVPGRGGAASGARPFLARGAAGGTPIVSSPGGGGGGGSGTPFGNDLSISTVSRFTRNPDSTRSLNTLRSSANGDPPDTRGDFVPGCTRPSSATWKSPAPASRVRGERPALRGRRRRRRLLSPPLASRLRLVRTVNFDDPPSRIALSRSSKGLVDRGRPRAARARRGRGRVEVETTGWPPRRKRRRRANAAGRPPRAPSRARRDAPRGSSRERRCPRSSPRARAVAAAERNARRPVRRPRRLLKLDRFAGESERGARDSPPPWTRPSRCRRSAAAETWT